MDWFLYDNGLRHERVKVITQYITEVRDIEVVYYF